MSPEINLWAEVLKSYFHDISVCHKLSKIYRLLYAANDSYTASICDSIGIEHDAFIRQLTKFAIEQISEKSQRGIRYGDDFNTAKAAYECRLTSLIQENRSLS